jgi:hypothetical protein
MVAEKIRKRHFERQSLFANFKLLGNSQRRLEVPDEQFTSCRTLDAEGNPIKVRQPYLLKGMEVEVIRENFSRGPMLHNPHYAISYKTKVGGGSVLMVYPTRTPGRNFDEYISPLLPKRE